MTGGSAAGAPPKIVPNVGDVFTVPLDEGKVACGQVIGKHKLLDLFVAIFAETFEADAEIDVDVVTATQPILLAHTGDALIWHGDWPIVGATTPHDWPRPTFKLHSRGPDSELLLVSYDFARRRPATTVELDVALRPTTVAPVAIEKALHALMDAGEWEPRFDWMRYDVIARAAALQV